jgi:hypothetical protein
MNPRIKNMLAIAAGIFIGGIVNGLIVNIGGKIVPLPAGVNANTTEGLKAGIHLFETKHFLFPFLAHAIGTLIGAFLAAFISDTNKLRATLVVGVVFLLGGVYMVFVLPAPTWFNIADLLLAYLPFAFVGYKLAVIKRN